MEIWQIAIEVIVDVALIIGAGLTICLPLIHPNRDEEAEEKKGEAAEQPKSPEAVEAPVPPVSHTFKEKERIEAKKTAVQKEEETENAIAVLFGGKSNIVAVTARGSRVTVAVKDTSLLRSQDFDRAGLKGAMIMSDRIVFLVGSNAEEFASNLKRKVGI